MLKTKLIPAAILVVMAAPPAVSCTVWKAIAAFDAIITAHAQRDVEDMDRGFEKILNAGNKLSAEQVNISTQMYAHRNKVDMEVETDRDNALADRCQETVDERTAALRSPARISPPGYCL